MKQLDGEMKQNVSGRCPIDKVHTTHSCFDAIASQAVSGSFIVSLTVIASTQLFELVQKILMNILMVENLPIFGGQMVANNKYEVCILLCFEMLVW